MQAARHLDAHAPMALPYMSAERCTTKRDADVALGLDAAGLRDVLVPVGVGEMAWVDEVLREVVRVRATTSKWPVAPLEPRELGGREVREGSVGVEEREQVARVLADGERGGAAGGGLVPYPVSTQAPPRS